MHTHNRKTVKPLIVVLLAAVAFAVTGPVLAGDGDLDDAGIPREGEPGFRTDIGVHLSLGGNSCLGGGTSYAECRGTDNAWDAGFGLTAGVLLRPWKHFSFGLDLYYGRMRYHQVTENRWSDFGMGPSGRFHYPIRVKQFVLEPSIGVQVGWVEGVYHQNKRGNTDVDYEHRHTGAFLGIPVTLDFFFLPRVAAGLEFRVVRTFYTEACFESVNGTICRGTDDDALTENDAIFIPGDKGEADFPWKLFWGIHLLYYI